MALLKINNVPEKGGGASQKIGKWGACSPPVIMTRRLWLGVINC